MVEVGLVAASGDSPVLVPGDTPVAPDGSDCDDGDSGGQHGQGHDHENFGPGG
jgi:hypothetical protein